MNHTINININELVSLKSEDEIYELVRTIITNNFEQGSFNKLLIHMLEDYNGYLKEFELCEDAQKSIQEIIKHFCELK